MKERENERVMPNPLCFIPYLFLLESSSEDFHLIRSLPGARDHLSYSPHCLKTTQREKIFSTLTSMVEIVYRNVGMSSIVDKSINQHFHFVN